MVDLPRVGDEASAAFEEAFYLAAPAALPASKGDVGVEGAAFGFEPDGLAHALDLGGERDEWLSRLDPSP
jgi:hypothetical protein